MRHMLVFVQRNPVLGAECLGLRSLIVLSALKTGASDLDLQLAVDSMR